MVQVMPTQTRLYTRLQYRWCAALPVCTTSAAQRTWQQLRWVFVLFIVLHTLTLFILESFSSQLEVLNETTSTQHDPSKAYRTYKKNCTLPYHNKHWISGKVRGSLGDLRFKIFCMNLKDKLVVISLWFESFWGVSCTTGSLIRVLNNIWTMASRKPQPELEPSPSQAQAVY